MADVELFIFISALIIVAFILFCIYFIFKMIQFVIVAVNLYKKMVIRQDAMISILLDIRDNTKKYMQQNINEQLADEYRNDCMSRDKKPSARRARTPASQSTESVENPDMDDTLSEFEVEEGEGSLEFCYHCGAALITRSKVCPKCGKKL